MRKRIFKILIIVGLPAAASLFFYRRVAVFIPGDELLHQKMDYLYSPGDKPDILFLGSSRTLNQIDPRVIDSVCGTHSYNLGLNAFNIAEMRMQLRVCLEMGKIPRVLVINLDPSSFNTKEPVYSFPEILGYALRDTAVRNSMAEVQDVYAWKWRYPFYRLQAYTALDDGFKVDAILGDRLYRSAKNRVNGEGAGKAGGDWRQRRGFEPIYDPYKETYVTPFNITFDDGGFALLRDIVHLCRRNAIEPVFVSAPMYRDYRRFFLNAGQVMSRAGRVLNEEGAPYFNLIDDSLAYREGDFFNFVHLNGWAAERYSRTLAVLLRDSVTGSPFK